MQNYFTDLKRWLEQVELGIRSSPSTDRMKTELKVVHEFAPTVLPTMTLSSKIRKNRQRGARRPFAVSQDLRQTPARSAVICSPFAYRTYQKPLGYAVDDEMVNMILEIP